MMSVVAHARLCQHEGLHRSSSVVSPAHMWGFHSAVIGDEQSNKLRLWNAQPNSLPIHKCFEYIAADIIFIPIPKRLLLQ